MDSGFPSDVGPTQTEYKVWRRERLRRVQTVAFVLPGAIAVILFMLRLITISGDFREYSVSRRLVYLFTEPLVLLTLLGMSLFGLSMLYLQSGFRRSTTQEAALYRYDDELSAIRRQLEAARSDSAEARKLAGQMTAASQRPSPSSDVSEERQAELVSTLEARIRQLAPETLLADLKSAADSRVTREAWLKDVSARFQDSFERLNREVQALGRRGNLNLALGTATTIVGLVLLGYFVLLTTADLNDPRALAVRFVPRLTLVVFIEVFAYFFLRLYKSSLSEIKYFQNEMTNMELKAVSLLAASQLPTAEALAKTIDACAQTERNRILEKGQTTVELRRAQIETDGVLEGLKEITSLLKRSSSGSV